MKYKSWLAWLVVLLALVPAALWGQEKAAAGAIAKEGEAEKAKFIRLRRDDSKKAIAMDTAVVRFASEKRPGVAVDLIGAVHVGDKAYYDELNKLFETYDVVLYELVAPEGTKVPKGGRREGSAHPIGAIQDGMSTMLELSHQLDCVDYTRANFVHADMSPDEFSKTMEQRGESFFQMFLRLMGQGMAQSAAGTSGTSDVALLFALFSRDRATKLKVAMAEQFDNLGGQLDAIDGPEGSTIIGERNRKCFEVLGKQLEEGKKKIAIFYGAGHLPDMEKRLVADFGMKRESEKWLTAWRLSK
jgi:hypothetical protein